MKKLAASVVAWGLLLQAGPARADKGEKKPAAEAGAYITALEQAGLIDKTLGSAKRLEAAVRRADERLTADEVDRRLAAGYRRQGVLLYHVACPSCSACEPIRLRVDSFEPSKTQRRILRRGRGFFAVEVGVPDFSEERLALYNRHKFERGLARTDLPMSPDGYRSFLVERCCDAV